MTLQEYIDELKQQRKNFCGNLDCTYKRPCQCCMDAYRDFFRRGEYLIEVLEQTSKVLEDNNIYLKVQ